MPRKNRRTGGRGLLLAALLLWPGAGMADNRLTATMGEVLIRNLQPGSTYHLTSLLNFPLRLTYAGEKPALLRIVPALPEPAEHKPGYDPIPDPGWVKLDPSEFSVGTSSVVESNVSIAIPDDEGLRGRKFIVYLWSQTMSEGKGLSLGLGAKSRLLITVAKEKAAPSQGPSKSYMQFQIDPPAVLLRNASPGKAVDLHKALGRKFYVQNTGGETQKFRLEVVPGSSLDMSPARESEWGPEGTEFKISPVKMRIKGGEKRKFKVRMKIPDEPGSYGKKYQYLLRVTPEGIGMTSGILFRINVETEARGS